jgi:hypothetical protein
MGASKVPSAQVVDVLVDHRGCTNLLVPPLLKSCDYFADELLVGHNESGLKDGSVFAS